MESGYQDDQSIDRLPSRKNMTERVVKKIMQAKRRLKL